MKRRDFIYRLGASAVALAIGPKIVNALADMSSQTISEVGLFTPGGTEGLLGYIQNNTFNYSGTFTYKEFNKYLDQVFAPASGEKIVILSEGEQTMFKGLMKSAKYFTIKK